MITKDELELIEKRAEAATEPPYFVSFDEAHDAPDHENSGLAKVDTGRSEDWPIARLCEWPQAEFIAHARDDIPLLCTSVRELMGENERLTSQSFEWTLAELRTMFPNEQVILTLRDCGIETVTIRDTAREYSIQIGINGDDFDCDTLSEALAAVRKDHQKRLQFKGKDRDIPVEPLPPAEPVCPFKIGDRVRQKHSSTWPEAKVTELTERGFKYEFDAPFVLGTRIGSTTGGECYETGFDSWELVQPASEPKDEMIPIYWFGNNGMAGPCESTIEALLEDVRQELEAYADPEFGRGKSITLIVRTGIMKRSDYDALPEFEGY